MKLQRICGSNLQQPQETTMPKVAAIVTCHNYERYLQRCLDTLLSQKTAFAKILVVDDSSDDKSAVAQICKTQRVECVRIEARSVAAARNVGMSKTTEPVLCFIDADNFFSSVFLERMLPAMSDPDLAVHYCPSKLVNDADTVIGDGTSIGPLDYERLPIENCIDTCNLVRREAIESVGGWVKTNPMMYEDWHLFMRISRAGWKIKFNPIHYWFYRVHEGQMRQAAP